MKALVIACQLVISRVQVFKSLATSADERKGQKGREKKRHLFFLHLSELLALHGVVVGQSIDSYLD